MRPLAKYFLIACALYGAAHYIRFKPSFASVRDTIPVTRIAPGGGLVHEKLDPQAAPYLALYHGAGWCGPCQRFSPVLEEFYRSADGAGRKFQLVMVDHDTSDGDMVAYMRQHGFGFGAVRMPDAGRWGQAMGNGIPQLIVVDTATGKVVSSSYEGADYVGCQVPLDALKRIALAR